MSRKEHTPDKIDAIAQELLDASNALRAISTAMREADLHYALLHGTLPQKTHLPAIISWVDKAGIDVKAQIRAKIANVPSSAQMIKEKAANQKTAAAKKPFTPKSGRKKEDP